MDKEYLKRVRRRIWTVQGLMACGWAVALVGAHRNGIPITSQYINMMIDFVLMLWVLRYCFYAGEFE